MAPGVETQQLPRPAATADRRMKLEVDVFDIFRSAGQGMYDGKAATRTFKQQDVNKILTCALHSASDHLEE
jgi:hypothetical protein